MSQKLAALVCRGRILTVAEHDMGTGGIGPREHTSRGFSGPGIGVDAHAAEVAAKSPLHKSACRRFQLLTGCRQHLVNDGRHRAGRAPFARLLPQQQP